MDTVGPPTPHQWPILHVQNYSHMHTFTCTFCFYNFSFKYNFFVTLFFINILNRMFNLLTYLSVHFSLAVSLLHICMGRSFVLEREGCCGLFSGHHIYVMQDHCWHCRRDRSHWHRQTVTLMPPWINWILISSFFSNVCSLKSLCHVW